MRQSERDVIFYWSFWLSLPFLISTVKNSQVTYASGPFCPSFHTDWLKNKQKNTQIARLIKRVPWLEATSLSERPGLDYDLSPTPVSILSNFSCHYLNQAEILNKKLIVKNLYIENS